MKKDRIVLIMTMTIILSFTTIFASDNLIDTHRHQRIEKLINNATTLQDSINVYDAIERYRVSHFQRYQMQEGVTYYDNAVNNFLKK